MYGSRPKKRAGRRFVCFVVLILVEWYAAPVWAQQTATGGVDTGYLKVDANWEIDSLFVVVDNQFEKAPFIANGDSIALPAGRRRITLSTETTVDRTFYRNVEVGQTTVLEVGLVRERNREVYLRRSSYPVLRSGINLVVVTDPDSEIIVDDVSRGQGIVKLEMNEALHLIQARHSEAGQRERRVTVQMHPPRLTWVEMYNKPSRKEVRRRSLVPGRAQFYKRQTLKGFVLASGFALTMIGGTYQHISFLIHNREYEQLRDEYYKATEEVEALRLGNQTEHHFNAARDAARWRNVLVAVAVGTYLYSLFDGVLNRPPGGYRTPSPDPIRLQPLFGTRQQGMRLVIRF